jgi:hypothetical protein
LGGKFEVEDGKGRERDEVLEKLNIDTFLIIPPKQQVNFDVLPGPPAGHFLADVFKFLTWICS